MHQESSFKVQVDTGCNKGVDITLCAHDAFLEQPSSSTLKVDKSYAKMRILWLQDCSC